MEINVHWKPGIVFFPKFYFEMFFSNFCNKLKRNILKKFTFKISTKFYKVSPSVDQEAESYRENPNPKEKKIWSEVWAKLHLTREYESYISRIALLATQ